MPVKGAPKPIKAGTKVKNIRLSEGDHNIDDDDQIIWHENDGSEGFTEHIISTQNPVSVHAEDMDSDGDIDVLAGLKHGGIEWYENDGNQSFSTHTIPATSNGMRLLSQSPILTFEL